MRILCTPLMYFYCFCKKRRADPQNTHPVEIFSIIHASINIKVCFSFFSLSFFCWAVVVAEIPPSSHHIAPHLISNTSHFCLFLLSFSNKKRFLRFFLPLVIKSSMGTSQLVNHNYNSKPSL